MGVGRQVAVEATVQSNGDKSTKTFAVLAKDAEKHGRDGPWTMEEIEAVGGTPFDPKYLDALGGKVALPDVSIKQTAEPG